MTDKTREEQKAIGQFLTPPSIANFMADAFTPLSDNSEVVDPGAGLGILGMSLYKKSKGNLTLVESDLEAYEDLMSLVDENKDANIFAVHENYIDWAIKEINGKKRFSRAIIIPPYFKIAVKSDESIKLRSIGIKTTNIYIAFVWLTLKLLRPNAELVAIIPRSFCNGAYFKNFRNYLAGSYSLDLIHLFDSRTKPFSKDKVLQETVIIKISKRPQTQKVKISRSFDSTFDNLSESIVDYQNVQNSEDPELIIHIPNKKRKSSRTVNKSLEDIGLSVSTGQVVSHRTTAHITKDTHGSIPLIYSQNLVQDQVKWPLLSNSKPQGIIRVTQTQKLIMPLDKYYVLVKRFSSKEQKKRVAATVIGPESAIGKFVAFENHLNFFHINKNGFNKKIAHGLAFYLNSLAVDEFFREFSGSTQVNVTDLKKLRYPSIKQLTKLSEEKL